MLTIGNSKLVEITMETGVTRYNLGDQKLLNGRRIRGIVAFNSGRTKGGDTVMDPVNGYMYLKEQETNDIRQEIPIKVITYAGAYPVLAFQEFDGRRYNWEESEVIFGSAVTAGEVLQLMVIYDQEQEL